MAMLRGCCPALALLLAACAPQLPLATASPSASSVAFATSCDRSVAEDFNRSVALLHHMTYTQARAGFDAILQRDPGCAMAQWGVAMTLFTPLWPTRPSPAELKAGWQAAQAAAASRTITPREQAYIRAAAEFFRDPESTDYWARIVRWETAQREVHDQFPEDPEAAAFAALALLANARPGPELEAGVQRATALLEPIERQYPRHPGALHYLVHASDYPGHERHHLDAVHRYESIAPENPHALHMPTHIYTRLGDWDSVIRGNLRAADAALRYPVGPDGSWVWDEFPHAIEYLVYAHLQEGADAEAARQIDRLLATPNLEPSAKTAFHLASTRARYALERRAWSEAAALKPRQPAGLDWDRFPWPEAIAWFARGYGSIRGSGDAARAGQSSEHLGRLEQRARDAGEPAFASQIVVLRLELDGWIAHARGADAEAVSLLQQAAKIEGQVPKPPVTPAATLPASELLGDLLLELKRPAEAAAAFRDALRRYPRRFNATLGLARASHAANDARAAVAAYCELARIGAAGSRLATLEDARRLADACPANSLPPIGSL